MKYCSVEHQLNGSPHGYLSSHELEEGFRKARDKVEYADTADPHGPVKAQTLYDQGPDAPFEEAGMRSYQPTGDGERYDCVARTEKGATSKS